MTASTAELRLNLGAWNTRIVGFKSVDIRREVKPDIVADVGFLPMEKETVSEIYASNILEHISHTETVAVLKEWRRVLVPGGKLWLSVPDFEVVLQGFPTHGLNDYLINLLYGEQKGKYEYHHICFTWPNLRQKIDEAGFASAERIVDLPFGLKDASTLVDNATFKSCVINALAKK